MEKKRLRTITILFSKKNRNSQITNKNEKNEKKENERKKEKRTKKRKNAIKTFLACMKKYTVLT